MILEFSYLQGTRTGVGWPPWKLEGRDEDGNEVKLYVDNVHIEAIVQKDFPQINELRKKNDEVRIPILYTSFSAYNVKAILSGGNFVFCDEENLQYRKNWDINPDQPRNLAKCVTVK